MGSQHKCMMLYAVSHGIMLPALLQKYNTLEKSYEISSKISQNEYKYNSPTCFLDWQLHGKQYL